jgi:hypothetical protein
MSPAVLDSSRPLISREKYPSNSTFLEEYCNSTCSASFHTFVTNAGSRCETTVYDFNFDIERSGSDLVAPLKWARDTACVTGASASNYCLSKILNRTVDFCDDCMFKYLAGMLSNAVGVGVISESALTSIAWSCKVEPTKYPHSTVSLESC